MVILLAAKKRMTDTYPAAVMLNVIYQPVKFMAADHVERLDNGPSVPLIG
jgi:hypothetical protein